MPILHTHCFYSGCADKGPELSRYVTDILRISMCDGLAVIGAGCGRTGTLSLKEALQILGYPCYHGFEMAVRGHEGQWHAALTGGGADWDEMFAGCRATVDFPAAVAFKELMEHYPDAKVILSTRDPERWAHSVMETIWSRSTKERSLVVRPWFRQYFAMGCAYRSRIFRDSDGGLASGAIDDPQRLKAAFVQWNDEVKASVPAERLLVFQAEDGWEPLCAFLGVPIPEVPYPRVNDSAQFRAMVAAHWRRYALLDAAVLAAVLAGAALAARTASALRR